MVLSVAALVASVAACGGTSTVSPSPEGTAVESPEPGTSALPSDGTATATPEPVMTDPPSEPPASVEPFEAPSGDPSPSADLGAADACTGTDENRDFFASVADAVDWPVYCPALTGRWFVDAGQYRLAGGGWLEISYRGPDGARITLREGAYCDGDDCLSAGTDLGAADIGDMPGALLDIGDGGYAVLVDPDGPNAWELIASGLSEDAVRAIAADLTLVEG